MKEASRPTSPPSRWMLLLESRATIDLVRMVGPLLHSSLRPAPARAGSSVIVVPGFGADDRWTRPLRAYLGNHGWEAEGWGLGKNLAGLNLRHSLESLSENWVPTPPEVYRGEAGVSYLCDLLVARIRERHRELGRPISLVGWSLGGYLAREAARDLPEIVDRVITLGSPVVGGPKYTAAARGFRERKLDLDWIEREVERREERPIRQPVTAIYSRSDGIVAWEAAIDRRNANVDHVEVSASHLGMIYSPAIWRLVAAALGRDTLPEEKQWSG